MITLGVNDLEKSIKFFHEVWAFPKWNHLLKLPSTSFSG